MYTSRHASHFFLCRESESILLVNSPFATTMVLPPPTKFSNVVHCMVRLFPPCLPHGVDIGLKKVPSNPLTTSGQPMGAKLVTKCRTRVPPICHQCTNVLWCSTIKYTISLPVLFWCDCLVYHKCCHSVAQVFQCFIATKCTDLGIAVLWVHNPPS